MSLERREAGLGSFQFEFLSFEPGWVQGRPLRHFVHGVDVIQTLHPVLIAPMYRVHAQVSGPALRGGLAALPDGHLRRPGVLIGHALD